jgi:ABC-type transporter Mla subunit MlaD
MPKKKRSELAAGVFVLVALVTLLGVILWLGAADIFRSAQQEASFWVHESEGGLGLEAGNPVKINDAVVGKITAIRFDADSGRTYYDARIDDPDIKIYDNGKAYPSVPFVGKGWLVISDRGSEAEKAKLCSADNPLELCKGGFMGSLEATGENLRQISDLIVAEMDRNDDKSLLAKVLDTITKVQGLADTVAHIGTNIVQETDRNKAEGMVGRLHQSLSDFNAITANLRKETDPARAGSVLAKVHGTLDKADQIATNVSNASKDVADLTAEARPLVKKAVEDMAASAGAIRKQLSDGDLAILLANLRKASTPMLATLKNIATITDQTREIIVMNRENIDETLDNLTQVSVNLKSVAKEVRRAPWKLFYTPKKDELHSQNIADAARAFSSGASELDQAISKLTALGKAKPQGIPSDDPQLKLIRKKLEDSFARFSRAEQALWKAMQEGK